MLYIANWKMNQSFIQAQDFLQEFKGLLKSEEEKNKFVFLPPAFLAGLFQSESFYWGAQNIHTEKAGAFTGENSAQTLLDMGAQFCLLGHSERRYGFGESEVEIEKKFNLLHELGLIPILCVGETAQEIGNKVTVFKRQLSWLKTFIKYEKLPWTSGNRPDAFRKLPFILAYEPVWAIGTGEIPEIQDLKDSIEIIKEHLHLDIPIFYGGSVNEENAHALSQQKDIAGFLIGGASLHAKELYKIYEASNS